MTNSAAALDALLPHPSERGVRPLSFAMAALLEKIESPLAIGGASDPVSLLPTLYAMTRPVSESMQILDSVGLSGYRATALLWGETLSTATAQGILEDVNAEISRLTAANPASGSGGADENPTAATLTGGSSPSLPRRANATAGRSAKSKKRRSRSSS